MTNINLSTDNAVQKLLNVYRSNRKLYKQARQQLALEQFFMTGFSIVLYSLIHVNKLKESLPFTPHVSNQDIQRTTADVLLNLTDRLNQHKYTDDMKSAISFLHGESDWGIPVDMSEFPKLPNVDSMDSSKFLQTASDTVKATDSALEAVERINDKMESAMADYWSAVKPFATESLAPVTPSIVSRKLGYEFVVALIGEKLLSLNRERVLSK